MRIKFEKTDSVEEMVQAISEYLLNENKDYPNLKSSASVYVNLVDENGNSHPNNDKNYIYKNGKIVSELEYLYTTETQKAIDSWQHFIKRSNKRNHLYTLVQDLKTQEPFVWKSSNTVNNKIVFVHIFLKFQDANNKTWWFYDNTLHDSCPEIENRFAKSL